jgi:hypothetical protein
MSAGRRPRFAVRRSPFAGAAATWSRVAFREQVEDGCGAMLGPLNESPMHSKRRLNAER